MTTLACCRLAFSLLYFSYCCAFVVFFLQNVVAVIHLRLYLGMAALFSALVLSTAFFLFSGIACTVGEKAWRLGWREVSGDKRPARPDGSCFLLQLVPAFLHCLLLFSACLCYCASCLPPGLFYLCLQNSAGDGGAPAGGRSSRCALFTIARAGVLTRAVRVNGGAGGGGVFCAANLGVRRRRAGLRHLMLASLVAFQRGAGISVARPSVRGMGETR